MSSQKKIAGAYTSEGVIEWSAFFFLLQNDSVIDRVFDQHRRFVAVEFSADIHAQARLLSLLFTSLVE